MMRLLAIFILTICSLSTTSACPKCDKQIIRKIKEKFWNNGHCPPKDLLRTGAFLSPNIVKRTTKDYYYDQDKITCVYTIFEGSVVSIYTQYDNSSTVYLTNVLQVTEQIGVLFDEANGIYRYRLYANRFGVTAIYRCSKIGQSGDPEGIVVVSGRRYEQEALDESVMDMASVGIKLTNITLSNSCVPKSAHQ